MIKVMDEKERVAESADINSKSGIGDSIIGGKNEFILRAYAE